MLSPEGLTGGPECFPESHYLISQRGGQRFKTSVLHTERKTVVKRLRLWGESRKVKSILQRQKPWHQRAWSSRTFYTTDRNEIRQPKKNKNRCLHTLSVFLFLSWTHCTFVICHSRWMISDWQPLVCGIRQTRNYVKGKRYIHYIVINQNESKLHSTVQIRLKSPTILDWKAFICF